MSIKKNLFTAGIVTVIAGILGVTAYNTYVIGKNERKYASIKAVYIKDVNNDGRQDIIIERGNGQKCVYLQSADNKYSSLDSVIELEFQKIKDKRDDIENKAK